MGADKLAIISIIVNLTISIITIIIVLVKLSNSGNDKKLEAMEKRVQTVEAQQKHTFELSTRIEQRLDKLASEMSSGFQNIYNLLIQELNKAKGE